MTCFIAQNELSAFVDDALEATRAAELQAHLTGCADCTRELQEIRRVRTMLRTLPVQRASRDFLAKVTAKAQRKSVFERAASALAPLLQLPRPAQAGLALAASLVVAVTVFWNNPNPSLSGLHSAPGGSEGFREVANVQAPTLALEPESSGAPAREAADADLHRNQPLADEKKPEEKQTATGKATSSEKRALAEAAPPPPPAAIPAEAPVNADKARSARSEVAAETTLAPTPAPVAGGRSGEVSSRAISGAGSTRGSGYTPPTSAGLYASDPAGTPVRSKNESAKVAMSPVKEAPSTVATRTTALDETASSEPPFDSSAAFGQSASSPTDTNDAWGAGDLATSGTTSTDSGVAAGAGSGMGAKPKAKDLAGAKKDLRRDRAASAAPAARQPAAEPKAGEDDAVAVEEDSVAESESQVVAAVSAPAFSALSAKYLSASPTAPAEVASAAKAAGGRLVSPASTPPGLGKAGASTVVIVEVPASGVAEFEDTLRASGTLERGTLPSGGIRFRVEVVRQ